MTKATTATLLKAFIHVCSFEISTNTGRKWPNLSCLEKAEMGEDCMILRAYKFREKSIILQEESSEDTKEETQQQEIESKHDPLNKI